MADETSRSPKLPVADSTREVWGRKLCWWCLSSGFPLHTFLLGFADSFCFVFTSIPSYEPSPLCFILCNLFPQLCWYVDVFKGKTVLYYSADYISFPLGSLGPLWSLWKWSSAHVYARRRKQYCKLHYCLWRVSIKPRLRLSYLKYVICFQMQSFWRLFKDVLVSLLLTPMGAFSYL